MTLNPSWDEAVAFARKRLDQLLPALEDMDGADFVYIQTAVEGAVKLNNLAFSDTSWVPEAEKLGPWSSRRSTSIPGEELASVGDVDELHSPYISELRNMLSKATHERGAFEAVSRHAADLRALGLPWCAELEEFVLAGLWRKMVRPAARRRGQTHPVRDNIICLILGELVQGFGVTLTRNEGSSDRQSACDILAAAMPKGARFPKTYVAVKRIWYESPAEMRETFLQPENVKVAEA
ncbi:hypothetical protein [Paracoccus everestensis]|uniref:hypothetical protein n=1 Tax=Paracoccus everestensis TaxID=2903900 RepID=UPI001F166403|nr:hypothetical protein [Paracoccus everestensis]